MPLPRQGEHSLKARDHARLHSPRPNSLAKAETLTEGAALSAALCRQRPSSSNMAATPWANPERQQDFAEDGGAAEGGRHQSRRGPWRRPADRRDAEAAGGREHLRRRPARDRCGNRADRRDGPGRVDQQGDRHLDRRRRRPRGSASRARTRAWSRRRRSAARDADPLQGIERHVDLGFVGEPVAVRPPPDRQPVPRRHHPGHRADRQRRRPAAPTTSTPTPWRGRSRRSWRRRASSS